jgi:hypothetical protein
MPSTRSTKHQASNLLSLATPAGQKERRLIELADEEDSDRALICAAPAEDSLNSELPPEELAGDQPGRPSCTARDHNRMSHQAAESTHEDAANTSFPATTADGRRGRHPVAELRLAVSDVKTQNELQ